MKQPTAGEDGRGKGNLRNTEFRAEDRIKPAGQKESQAEIPRAQTAGGASSVPEKIQKQATQKAEQAKSTQSLVAAQNTVKYTDEELKNMEQFQEEMKMKGRLLPDSAHTTYFGRPAWHAYGNANTKPAQGGLIYGDYMKTHNINPHSGANKPECAQIYARAQRGQ